MVEGTTLATQVALAIEAVKSKRLESAKIHVGKDDVEVLHRLDEEGKVSYSIAGAILESLTTPAVIEAINGRASRV